MIAIVNSGLGNGRSVLNMTRRVGFVADLVDDPRQLVVADCVVLPGVGSFDAGVKRLKETGIWDTLLEANSRGIPILGICLGMQLLSNGSAEGDLAGLGIVDAYFERLPKSAPTVPHVGWNRVRPTTDSELFPKADAPFRFYFVHSYFAIPGPHTETLATAAYGEEFCVAYRQGTATGVQFHPEKSHRHGLALLKGFFTHHA